MVQLFQTSIAYPFPFPLHAYAVINKYPNPHADHVVSMDVLSRSILPDGTIRSERLIGVRQDSPRWINRMLGTQDTTFVREVSFLLPSSIPATPSSTIPPPPTSEPPKLLMASCNLTLSTVLQCRESISYLPHPWPYSPVTTSNLAPSPPTDSVSPDEVPTEPAPRSHPLSHPHLPPSTLFSQSALIFSCGSFASSPWPPRGTNATNPIGPNAHPAASTAPQRAAGRKVEAFSLERFEKNATAGREAMAWAARRAWVATAEGERKAKGKL